jgi:hypothetical protein
MGNDYPDPLRPLSSALSDDALAAVADATAATLDPHDTPEREHQSADSLHGVELAACVLTFIILALLLTTIWMLRGGCHAGVCL